MIGTMRMVLFITATLFPILLSILLPITSSWDLGGISVLISRISFFIAIFIAISCTTLTRKSEEQLEILNLDEETDFINPTTI